MSAESALMRPEEVAKALGVHRETLRRMVKAEQFPAPIKITPKTNRWLRSEVDAHIASRPRGMVEEAA